VEAVISPQRLERRADSQELCRRCRLEQLVGIEFIERPSGVKRIELDSEERMAKFGSRHYLLNALREGRWRILRECWKR
jgi:hypothetical protein